jgi:Domain of unknown function (DUF3597)
MSMLGKIMNAVFGTSSATAASAPGGAPEAPAGASAGEGSAPLPSAPAGQKVDVGAVLDKAVKDKKQKLNWKTSIVDLMKALDLDSSLAARKELAKDLHYTGDTGDSATMNVWLHKQLMIKLEANGGKVPADLTS